MLDLELALNTSGRTPFIYNWENWSFEEMELYTSLRGHCSGLVKVTGDFSDLLVSHSSWFTYQAMNRIYKHYKLNLKSKAIAAKTISFSSYPGFLVSLDDFYIMDSGLAMIQTTNNVFNLSLYELVTPQSLFAWQRVRLANSMAKNGEEWYQIVSQYNSGTYNNQYMVINYNLFVPRTPLSDGLLWVVEQIPGLVVGADKTEDLRRGYWPSYNVPYFKEIYEQSGYSRVAQAFGPSFSYQLAPRAEIFRRDSDEVVSLETLETLMRSNNYLTDPYAKHNPMRAVCSRGDLIENRPSTDGCYDTKVTNFSMMQDLASFALNGPTTNAGQLPPFSWDRFSEEAHHGQPQVFNFDFVLMKPKFKNAFAAKTR